MTNCNWINLKVCKIYLHFFLILHHMKPGHNLSQVTLKSDYLKNYQYQQSQKHIRSPRLLCVRSLGALWYDYVYFNIPSSSTQWLWVISLLQYLTKLSILNMFHYATMSNKTCIKLNWRCFKNQSMIGPKKVCASNQIRLLKYRKSMLCVAYII